MWFQVPGVPISSSLLRSAVRISLIRPDIVRRFASHSAKSCESLSTAEAMRAPYAGGFEISERWRMASCEAMRPMVDSASEDGEVTKWKQPARSPYRPKFLAYD